MTRDNTALMELLSDQPADRVSESIPGYKLSENFTQLQYARIMMVDDEPITMEAVQTFLEDAGYREFVLVEDSTKAINQLRQHQPDILLLDVIMPEVSGFDILKALRKDPEFASAGHHTDLVTGCRDQTNRP